jgi:hypothetical protein
MRRNRMTNLSQFVGQTVKFAAEPYDFGTIRIDAIEPGHYEGEFRVSGTVVEGETRSRIGGCVSYSPINGQRLDLYRLRASDFERGFLRYVYPV